LLHLIAFSFVYLSPSLILEELVILSGELVDPVDDGLVVHGQVPSGVSLQGYHNTGRRTLHPGDPGPAFLAGGSFLPAPGPGPPDDPPGHGGDQQDRHHDADRPEVAVDSGT